MTKIKLLVGLKIPDTTAITAFHTLEKMGFDALEKLERFDYYEFVVLKDSDQFAKDIVGVDVLVNANKNSATIVKENESVSKEHISVLVSAKDDESKGLFSLLRERMGFDHLSELRKGVLWQLHLKNKNKETAKRIANELLANEHYQDVEIL